MYRHREFRMVETERLTVSEWTSEGKQKRHSLSMGDGVWLSVIKGLHMIVCVSGCVKASSRVVPQEFTTKLLSLHLQRQELFLSLLQKEN